MYEWNAVFERQMLLNTEGGRDESLVRSLRGGRTEALTGQDVVRAIMDEHGKLGDLIQLQMRRIEE